MSEQIMAAFAVPAMLVGTEPAIDSRMARGSYLVAMAEAAGIDPFDLRRSEVDEYLLWRWRQLAGVALIPSPADVEGGR